MAKKTKKTTIMRPRPQLLPCPCCGGKPTYMEGEGSKSIRCTECGLRTVNMAFGAFVQTDSEAEYALAKMWNRRTNCENA